MIEFINRLFGRQNSGATAKERLRLVLMSDHLSLAPEMIESMKRDLVDVISKYVQVDREKIDVHFENQDNALAMLANIPITGVNRDGGDSSRHPEPVEGATPGHAATGPRHPEPVEGLLSEAEAKAPTNSSSKRKRLKSGSQNGHSPQNGAAAPAT
jgi:cell division topological specificity factor